MADCRAAHAEDPSHRAVRDVVARAVAEPAVVLKMLGSRAARSAKNLSLADMTILNVVWAPYMTIYPHNHRMWAVIGVYTGREDNIFWRRSGPKVEAAGAQALCARDAAPLGQDIIHSVTNPIPRFTGAIHVYGGDFFAVERSEWDPETLLEGRYDAQKTMRHFEAANSRSELAT